MNLDTGSPTGSKRQRIFTRPSTHLGWWSVRLAAAFVVLYIINAFVFMPAWVEVPFRETILPFYGITMVICGLAAGTTAFLAIVWRKERSWVVWLILLPGLMMLFLLVGELLVPH